MAYIIPQINMFDYTEIEILGDLERLVLAINNIDDEKIVEKLSKSRGNGRNDFPISAMLNGFYAMKIYGHNSMSSLCRELSRNPSMMKICGFKSKCPNSRSYSNFLKNLENCEIEIKELLDNLIKFMYDNIEGFGETVAGDGKIIESYANKPSKKEKTDRRSETDADFTKKTYSVTTDKGEKITKTKRFFGFRVHAMVDTKTELPISIEVTKASISEKKEMLKMFKNMPEYMKNKMKLFTGDKGYDWTELNKYLCTENIIPVIDICNKWKDGEATKQYKDTDLVYTYNGEVYYIDQLSEKHKLKYLGYDKNSDSLRYGFDKTKILPKDIKENKVFRIKLEEDRRIFVPIARDSEKWKRIYKARTTVERYNGRLDRDLGFELHTIRGLKKMKTFVYLSNILMLGMAKGKVISKQTEHLAALIKIA